MRRHLLDLVRGAFAWLLGAVVLIVTLKPRLARWLTDTITHEQADIVTFGALSVNDGKER